jgi:hypothetical protein
MMFGYGLLSGEEQELPLYLMPEKEANAGTAALRDAFPEDCEVIGVMQPAGRSNS